MNAVMKSFSATVVAAFVFLVFFMFARVVMGADLPADMPTDEFFNQVLALIKGFGGLSWSMKISGVVLLILATMKVSFLRPLWDKLGNFKAIAAPVLGLLAGVLSLSLSGQLTLPGVAAYVFVGAGALTLHELLDMVKLIPGLGPIWLWVINLIQGIPAVGSGLTAKVPDPKA